MDAVVQAKLPLVLELCRRYRVRRLDLFGSAAPGEFDPSRSDLDFVLEYLPEAKAFYPDVYFELKAALEALFGRSVDLVMLNAIRNPYLRAAVEKTRVSLYAA